MLRAPPIPLEDNAGDVVGKARRGWGHDVRSLAAAAGVTAEDVGAAQEGRGSEAAWRALARPLKLRPDALADLAYGRWKAPEVSVPGLLHLNVLDEDMYVNVFGAADPASGEAVLFDTGPAAEPVLEALASRGWKLRLILLTHEHGDHVAALGPLVAATGAPAWISARAGGTVAGARGFPDDPPPTFSVGSLRITARPAPGHARGGSIFLLQGLSHTIAISGDALFAGSMGGTPVAFEEALRWVRTSILTLPDDTILAPGHGPLSTVGHERRFNPFLVG